MDFSKLNDEQRIAVETTQGPVLILAGAGSGKTTVLINRLVNIIEKGIDAKRILLLTFTNKAANEMTQRAQSMLDERALDVNGTTYHSFCAEILRRHAPKVGFTSDFSICDSSDAAEMINLIKEKNGYTKEMSLPNGKELIDMFSYMLNKEKTLTYTLENRYPSYIGQEMEIEKIKEDFIIYKYNKNILDYDDLLTQVINLFETYPEICKNISDYYQYIMVDEYQDSNLLQMQLIKLLRQFENKNICVVGDQNQSIYGFRGSLYENILNFPDMFSDCKIIKLNKNYRSNQEILDLSNAVTSDMNEKFKNNLIGTHHCGYKPRLIKCNGQNDEARFIINQINNYRRNGMSLNDMAVLVRGSYDSNMLESLLIEQSGKNAIEYQKFGGIKFFERDFVKNIFAYLKIITNYKDEISWFRILKLYPGIGSVNAKKISEGILENGKTELIEKKYTKKTFAKYLEEINEFLIEIDKLDFQEQMEYLVNEYYYKTIKRSIQNMKTTPVNIKKHLRQLDEEIEQAQVLITLSENYKTASKFVNDVLLEVPQKSSENDKLTISTIHSVKGLEFKVVFVLNCIEGKFPWLKEAKALTDEAMEEVQKEMQEEQRVFYVAITRAKDDLYLMYPQYDLFRHEETQLSRFLASNNNYKKYCDVINFR